MTHEGRAKLIKWILLLLLAGGVIVGVLLYGSKQNVEPLKPVNIPENGLNIVLYEKAGQPESQSLIDTVDRIGTKYDKLVVITHIDVDAHPAETAKAGVKQTPHVFMIAKSGPVFNFQGLWPREKVELKVDEILNGLKRVGKEWRPPVPGMKREGM